MNKVMKKKEKIINKTKKRANNKLKHKQNKMMKKNDELDLPFIKCMLLCVTLYRVLFDKKLHSLEEARC